MSKKQPQFPLYVPTKGRSQYMITSKALTVMGVHHYLVVEPDQVDDYERAVQEMKILATVLPMDMSYKEKYELCDHLGLTRSTGPGPARNFIWDHSKAAGFKWHWVMDDNIIAFWRWNNNREIRMQSGVPFRVMEDFCLRYTNIAMAGPNYYMFAPRKTKMPPFTMNTRIYSCNLIRNDLPFRWRGRYNEDTILSLDMLKAGWCTVQFNAFLQFKLTTQTIKGGNTDEFYHKEGKVHPGSKYADTGTVAKSQMLVNVHPDLCRLTWRFSRWYHYANYKAFRYQKLILKEGLEIPSGTNDYGMELTKRKK